MRLTLISPRIAVQKGDFLGSGVPYWPIELAVLAAFLRERGDDISVVDLFGANPKRLSDQGDYYLQGAPWEDYADSVAARESDAFILYALSYMSHGELLDLVRKIKAARPDTPVVVMENSQAVTAYSLPRMAAGYFAAGANGLLCGEPYHNWNDIETWIGATEKRTPPCNILASGEGTNSEAPVQRLYKKDARYPAPAWDLFNLEDYWSLPYAHGPKTKRFLPMLTSRGCPWPCDFCVVPETNDRRWRARPALDVVDEMMALKDQFDVADFQIEDLNPTVRSEHWDEIARLLIERKAGIRFYFVSGTKAETVKINQVERLARAGCRYISISPESGSEAIMKTIGKRFDYDHGLALVHECRRHGIRTQACFLVGHPAETEEDYLCSREYLRRMVRAGLDEAAIFVVASFAGSKLFAAGGIAQDDPEALPSFSPKGREGYADIERRRKELIRTFFIEKLKRGGDLWMQGLRAIAGRPQTKMENLPRRIVYIWMIIARKKLKTLFGGGA